MLSVEDWAGVRRLHRAEGMRIKVIARVLGISRNTVRAAIASDAPPKYVRKPAGSVVDGQLEESTIAGAAYRSGLAELGWYRGGEYVITDEAGTPVHPEWYSDEFGRLLRRAGLRRMTLHDSRHTTLTLMEHEGVPISIISKWAGHYNSAFTQKTYVHASEEDLQRGQAVLARIHKIA